MSITFADCKPKTLADDNLTELKLKVELLVEDPRHKVRKSGGGSAELLPAIHQEQKLFPQPLIFANFPATLGIGQSCDKPSDLTLL